MWAGTFFGGVSYYSEENARFEKYYQLPGINSISGDAVREICSDNKGHLWIGTEDAGINKLDLKTGQFTNYTATGKSGDISYPNVHGLLAVGNQLFIGPFLHGMEIMDIRTGKITDHFRFIGDKKDKTSDFVLHISLTRDSTLLVGTAYNGSGLFIYDRQHKTFKRIKEIPYNSYVFDIKEDSQGNIWTGSVTQGAFFITLKPGKVAISGLVIRLVKRSSMSLLYMAYSKTAIMLYGLLPKAAGSSSLVPIIRSLRNSLLRTGCPVMWYIAYLKIIRSICG